jgi:hypothetical protein
MQDALIELLAREHRTVEGLVHELDLLDERDVDAHSELYAALRVYAHMSKVELVEALTMR